MATSRSWHCCGASDLWPLLPLVIGIRSTTLDSWTQDQLKLMSFGGNGRARVFFKQHGWTDGGRIESKYTSRAAELYRQLLAKEVAKSFAAATSLAQIAAADRPENGLSPKKVDDDFFEEHPVQQPAAPAPTPSSTPRTRPASSSVTRKPTSSLGVKKLVARNVGGGLGVKKLTTKVKCNQMLVM